MKHDDSLIESVSTVGRDIYPGVSFGIRVKDDPYPLADAQGHDIYQICVITEGSVILSDAGAQSALIPPQLLCLSYLNPMKRLDVSGAKGFSVLFVPKVINYGLFNEQPSLSDDPSRSESSSKIESLLAEKLLIKPFKQGDISNPFHIALGPSLQDRITDMYKGLHDQFILQPNNSWPCRGRSYFLEILLLLQNLYAFEGDSPLDLPLPKGDPAVEDAVKAMLLRYPDPAFRPTDAREPLRSLAVALRFRRLTGLAPKGFLRLIRLTVAANLIRNTLLSPSDIAVRCGYTNPSAFDRDFAKLYRKNPMTYRAGFPNPYG